MVVKKLKTPNWMNAGKKNAIIRHKSLLVLFFQFVSTNKNRFVIESTNFAYNLLTCKQNKEKQSRRLEHLDFQLSEFDSTFFHLYTPTKARKKVRYSHTENLIEEANA